MRRFDWIAFGACLVLVLSLLAHYMLLTMWGEHLELARAETAERIATAEGRVLKEVISQEFRLEIKDLTDEERLDYVAMLACRGEEEIESVETVAMIEEEVDRGED